MSAAIYAVMVLFLAGCSSSGTDRPTAETSKLTKHESIKYYYWLSPGQVKNLKKIHSTLLVLSSRLGVCSKDSNFKWAKIQGVDNIVVSVNAQTKKKSASCIKKLIQSKANVLKGTTLARAKDHLAKPYSGYFEIKPPKLKAYY